MSYCGYVPFLGNIYSSGTLYELRFFYNYVNCYKFKRKPSALTNVESEGLGGQYEQFVTKPVGFQPVAKYTHARNQMTNRRTHGAAVRYVLLSCFYLRRVACSCSLAFKHWAQRLIA